MNDRFNELYDAHSELYPSITVKGDKDVYIFTEPADVSGVRLITPTYYAAQQRHIPTDIFPEHYRVPPNYPYSKNAMFSSVRSARR